MVLIKDDFPRGCWKLGRISITLLKDTEKEGAMKYPFKTHELGFACTEDTEYP